MGNAENSYCTRTTTVDYVEQGDDGAIAGAEEATERMRMRSRGGEEERTMTEQKSLPLESRVQAPAPSNATSTAKSLTVRSSENAISTVGLRSSRAFHPLNYGPGYSRILANPLGGRLVASHRAMASGHPAHLRLQRQRRSAAHREPLSRSLPKVGGVKDCCSAATDALQLSGEMEIEAYHQFTTTSSS